MVDSSDEFDPELPEEGEVAGEAAGDRTDFFRSWAMRIGVSWAEQQPGAPG